MFMFRPLGLRTITISQSCDGFYTYDVTSPAGLDDVMSPKWRKMVYCSRPLTMSTVRVDLGDKGGIYRFNVRSTTLEYF